MTRKSELSQAWEDAYSYKRHTERPREIVVPKGYWLFAFTFLPLLVLLMQAVPGN